MREAMVNKDAENVMKDKMEDIDVRISQAEFAIEQKYTTLLYELQDEKDNIQNQLKDVQSELTSTLLIVKTNTKRNESLEKQIQQSEETRIELENEIVQLKKGTDSDVITELKTQLQVSLDKNTEFKDAVARIKWRSKEEIDHANDHVIELKRSLLTLETEQQQLSAELVRVMTQRDTLEAELEGGRINIPQKGNSNDISDLDSLSGSVDDPSSNPRSRLDGRNTLSTTDPDSLSLSAPVSVSYEDHKSKLSEKQAALDDMKKKHFSLMEEMEDLRLQHTELIENNMLERKNREKLLKVAQKDASTIQKEYKQCQKYAAALEKELTDYLSYHKRQTEVKDSTIQVHKELAKSRAANADLAKQLVECHSADSTTQQLNADLQAEVTMLLAEMDHLHAELDKKTAAIKASKWRGDHSDSDDSADSEDIDDDNDAVFCNSFRSNQSPRSSTGTLKQANKNRPPRPSSAASNSRGGGGGGRSSLSPADFDTLKQMYLATALDSIDKQRKSPHTAGRDSPASSIGASISSHNRAAIQKPKMRPRQTNTNLNDHYSPTKRFSN
jgi:chromosome segregation ATPase